MRNTLIDAHVHAYTKKQFDALEKSMEAAGIDCAVIMYWPFGKWRDQSVPSLEKVVEEVKRRNAKSERFAVVGSLQMTEERTKVNNNIKRLDRLLADHDISGIKLYPGYEHFYPYDILCSRVFRLCYDHEAPLVLHTGDCWSQMPQADPSYANPLHVKRASITHDPCTIVLAHCGNPWLAEAAMVLNGNKKIYADLSAVVPFGPRGRCVESFHDAVRSVRHWCQGAEQLLFGTDYDIYPQKECADWWSSFQDMTPDEKARGDYGNAAALFHI
jgi:predicted TIM-barrel fold metal-dependent hydrolase